MNVLITHPVSMKNCILNATLEEGNGRTNTRLWISKEQYWWVKCKLTAFEYLDAMYTDAPVLLEVRDEDGNVSTVIRRSGDPY